MTPFILLIIAVIWFAGAALRVYRLARFYQIEEYKTGRFLRWLISVRDRWLPGRPVLAAVIASVLMVLFSEGGAFLPVVIALAAAVAAGWPPHAGEIKKRFQPTRRAQRLLGAAFAMTGIAALAAFSMSAAIQSSVAIAPLIALTAAGLLTFLVAPLWLTLGNLVMTPVEALFRRRFVASARRVLEETHPVVIGITGSYGKTTTKTFLAHILSGRYKVYPTPKSYNTLMGVCIAINRDLADDRSIEYFIAEMGAYIPGEIERICALTHPLMSIVVEVGPQHLERFKTLENVARAKYEIVKALPADGTAFLNWDNPYVREMFTRGYPPERIAVSLNADADAPPPPEGPRLVASSIEETLDGLRFRMTDRLTGDSVDCAPPLYGRHNVLNILLASAVAVHERISLDEIARRLFTLTPAESRLVRTMTPEGIIILNDAYSANPVGMESALHVLDLHRDGRRVLVTPGMVELGDLMERENQRLGAIAAKTATDIILVGVEQTKPIQAGLVAAGFPPEHTRVVETLQEALDWTRAELKPGDCVLFMNDLPDTYFRTGA